LIHFYKRFIHKYARIKMFKPAKVLRIFSTEKFQSEL